MGGGCRNHVTELNLAHMLTVVIDGCEPQNNL